MMNLKVTKKYLFVSFLFLFPFSLQANQSEVTALHKEVILLNQKIEALNGRVTTMQGHISPAPGRESTAQPGILQGQEIPAGLIHTLNDIHMGGYLDVEYNANLTKTTSNIDGNPERFFDRDQNTFVMHAAQLTFQKEAKPEGGAGFRLDLVVGRDAQINDAQTSGTDGDEFSTRQAYVEWVTPLRFWENNSILPQSVKVMAGRMITLAGFEAYEAPQRWNISGSFMFALAEPGTHTGVRTNFGLLKDFFNVSLGVNNGWDNVVDNNQWKTIESALSFKPVEKIAMTSTFYFGPENDRQSGHKRYLFTQTAQWEATSHLTFALAIDFGSERRVPHDTITSTETEDIPGLDFQNAEWHGYAGYVRYQFNDKWAMNYRIDFFRDDRLFFADARNLWEQTVTAEYKFYDNLISRLEFRHDKENDGEIFNGRSYQNTLEAQLVYII